MTEDDAFTETSVQAAVDQLRAHGSLWTDAQVRDIVARCGCPLAARLPVVLEVSLAAALARWRCHRDGPGLTDARYTTCRWSVRSCYP